MENKKEEFRLRINGDLVPAEVINPFIKAIRKEEREITAKEIFAEIEDWTFNLAEDREKEILISDTGKYKALKLAFLPNLKVGVSSEVL